jgi:hypothetical protein
MSASVPVSRITKRSPVSAISVDTATRTEAWIVACRTACIGSARAVQRARSGFCTCTRITGTWTAMIHSVATIATHAATCAKSAACTDSSVGAWPTGTVLRDRLSGELSHTHGGFEPYVCTSVIDIGIELPQRCECDAIHETYQVASVTVDHRVIAAAVLNGT